MKFLPFVFKHLRRNWVRTTSTVLAMAVCIFLFCTLQTILAAVSWSLRSASANRLVTRHAVSIVFNLPLAYQNRIAAVPGVKGVARNTFFGGTLPAKREERSAEDSAAPDFTSFFPNLAVDPENYFPMYPELQIPADQMEAFRTEMRGCLIGRRLAERYGWKVGDTFFLESFIPPYRRSSGPFEFVVSGIFDADLAKNPGTDTLLMLFKWDYLYEGLGRRGIGVGTYVVEVADPGQAGAVSRAIDELFENSDAQTKTETEAAFRASFISAAGNLAFLLNGIGVAVTFTILLVTANTMSMALRERRTEIAVLKTLGFTGRHVMGLILAESLLLGALGGGLGLVFGWAAIHALPGVPFIGDVVRAFPDFGLSPVVAGLGFGNALFLGVLAGFVPAYLAFRSRITEMLRPA
jgi:putative ABC transport system permease protein